MNYFSPELSVKQIDAISALGLAHMGDALFELLVRSYLCAHGQVSNAELHRQTVRFVSAPSQAAFVEKLLPRLDEQELSYYKRGRNAHPHLIPKNATPGQYARASGLEALFGALFLLGRRERLLELFAPIMEELYAL